MSFLLGVLVVVIGLIVSVALHECGHMLPAKKFGAAVPKYMVGFGPTLWAKRVGGTVYGIKAIVLGGYVRIGGMFPPARADEVIGSIDGEPIRAADYELMDRSRQQDIRLTLAQEAREASAADLLDQHGRKAFWQLSTSKKIVVMFSGPLVNLLLAVGCAVVTLAGIGVAVPETSLASVDSCSDASCHQAAFKGGLRSGDKITSIGGVPTNSWQDITRQIKAHSSQLTPFEVIRDGHTRTVRVTIPSDGPIGITAATSRKRLSASQVAQSVWQQFTGTLAVIGKLPVQVFEVSKSVFTGAPRDPNGVVSVVGVGHIAGDVASTAKVTLTDRIAMLISLWGGVNMALFAFNLIPLLPLDGGHIAGALWEGVRNFLARMRGQKKPQPVDTARLMPLTYGVFGVFLLLTVLLVVADFVVPIQLS